MKDVHRLNTSAAATVSAPAPVEGAAGGAPQLPAQQGEAASSAQPQASSATGTVPTLLLPLKPRQQAPQGDDPDSSDSSSSSSSSDTPAPSRPACRVCGSKAHDEADCPFLTVNRPRGDGGDGGGSPSTQTATHLQPRLALARRPAQRAKRQQRLKKKSSASSRLRTLYLPCSARKRSPGTRFCKPSANGDWQTAALARERGVLVGTRLHDHLNVSDLLKCNRNS